MPLLLLWAAATVGIWIIVILGARRQSEDENDSSRMLTRVAIGFGAVPPTLICLVSAFVLLQAEPTRQYNGSSYTMASHPVYRDVIQLIR